MNPKNKPNITDTRLSIICSEITCLIKNVRLCPRNLISLNSDERISTWLTEEQITTKMDTNNDVKTRK
jgi:hypothetical protein